MTFFSFQEGSRGDRKEGGKRGRKPGRKASDKTDMKAKLGKKLLQPTIRVIQTYTHTHTVNRLHQYRLAISFHPQRLFAKTSSSGNFQECAKREITDYERDGIVVFALSRRYALSDER